MATHTQAAAQAPSKSPVAPTLILLAGWLVPGAGHFLLRKWIRGSLLLLSILAMLGIGLALQGKIYTAGASEILDMLNFAGDLGTGVLYFAARAMDLGTSPIQTAVADYGSKFIVVAGLLNIISAVDAHSLATGRKHS